MRISKYNSSDTGGIYTWHTLLNISDIHTKPCAYSFLHRIDITVWLERVGS